MHLSLGLFDVSSWAEILTPDRVILFVCFVGSAITNIFQWKDKRGVTIHETDLDTIASLERANARLKEETTQERTRADGTVGELASVKRELVSLMAIDIHELLEFAALKRRNVALERECEGLNEELAHKLVRPQLGGGGGKGGGNE